MTGNLVLLGLAVAQGQLLESLRSVVALVGFVAGAMLGSWLVGTGLGGEIWPARVTLVLTVELLLLVVFLAAWLVAGAEPPNGEIEVLIIISAAAMGVQSTVGRRLAVAGVTTTYVTGTLTTLIAELVAMGRRQPGATRWLGVLVSLTVGAIVSAILMQQARAGAPLLPVIALGGVVLVARAAFPHHASPGSLER